MSPKMNFRGKSGDKDKIKKRSAVGKAKHLTNVLKEKLGLAEPEPENEYEENSNELTQEKGFSEFTLDLNLPSISIAKKGTEYEDDENAGGLSGKTKERLANMESKIDELLTNFHQLNEYSEITRMEMEVHTEAISSLERKVADLDVIREGYADVERNLRELAALYDLISAHMNPFVEFKETIRQNGRDDSKKPESVQESDKKTTRSYLRDWLNFLLSRMTKSNVQKLLEYYRELNWLDDFLLSKAKNSLDEMGIDSEPGEQTTEGWMLSPKNQAKSMELLEKVTRRGE